ncbi:hypothetical protein [Halorubrum sp. AS12]|uniref:hypothetical protein n=1 Tax=Halorubrum sp. AS12 TaxID=3409687 RepID=UPI003DA6CEB8
MNRRSYLAGAGGASGLLAGCTDSLVFGDSGVSPRDLPDRPADLTPESVAAYIAAYEEVRVHNVHAERGADEVTVRAAATFDHAAGDDHYATVRHAGTVYESDGGARSVGELAGLPTPYLVAPDRTLRFGLERRTVDADVGDQSTGDAAGNTVSPPLGVRLINVSENDREVSVTVTRRADDGTTDEGDNSTDGDGGETPGEEPVARSIQSVPPESAVELRSIADARGGYRIVARTADDGTTAEGRIEVGLPSADRAVNADVVIDGDGVSAWHLPALEPL